MTIKSSIDYYEPLFKNVVHNTSLGDMPRELEDAIDRTTREGFEAVLHGVERLQHRRAGKSGEPEPTS